jgi:hypothetical protein
VPKLRPAEDRTTARALRREGRSLREIAEVVGAARSTVSLWVRDIPLSEAQQAALDDANPVVNHRRSGQLAWSRMNSEARSAAQEDGRRRARERSLLHQAGCMLYWADGSKHRNHVTFTNSDVDMVRFFLRFLCECYGIDDAQVIHAWWLEHLALPASSLRAPAINRTSTASKRVRRPLIHGTARLAVHSTFVVQSIYGAIQEYVGCSRPEWADSASGAVRPG